MKEIPQFPGYYATTDGEIISMRSGIPRQLVKQIHKGYYHVFVRRGLGRKTQVKIPVHQLVLTAYKGNKPGDGYVSRHLDGDCFNNRPYNLEWGTVSENVQDSIRHGTAACLKCGDEHPAAKLKENDVLQIIDLLNQGLKQSFIAGMYGISQRHVSDIKLGKTWKQITLPRGA